MAATAEIVELRERFRQEVNDLLNTVRVMFDVRYISPSHPTLCGQGGQLEAPYRRMVAWV